MLGVNLLVRLGRQLLAGPVADSGFFPPGYYRHLVLEALEEEDFPQALRWLKWAEDPLLAQLVVLRLRLLAARHRRERQAIRERCSPDLAVERRQHYLSLLAQQERAVQLLGEYETQALAVLGIADQPGNRNCGSELHGI